MRKVLLLTPIALLFLCVSVSAQDVNTDSLNLVSKINADQIKLDKLQSRLQEQIKKKEQATMRAQESANENLKAANKLSDKPGNKKLARRADKKASIAKRDAKNARKASGKVDDLQKDIENTKQRIAANQGKLNKFKEGRRE